VAGGGPASSIDVYALREPGGAELGLRIRSRVCLMPIAGAKAAYHAGQSSFTAMLGRAEVCEFLAARAGRLHQKPASLREGGFVPIGDLFSARGWRIKT